MKKNNIFWYLLDSIFIIVFNLYFFLLTNIDRPSSVWISYFSIHFAYLMLIITPFFVRKGSSSADYGRPLFTITTIYFFIALVVGISFIIISPINNTPALLIQFTITAIFVILLLTNLIANEHTAENIQNHEEELKYVKECSSKLDLMLKQISDNIISKKVEKIYDLIHSSQIKSSNNVKVIEQTIINEIFNLEESLKLNQLENIQILVDKISNLANERNRILKNLN